MKTIYFIRHAEAEHNPPCEEFGKGILTDKKYFDANLTEHGIEQCLNAKEKLSNLDLDILFVSPLTRTLQTATMIFKDTGVDMHAIETIRERFGVRPCDQRSGIPTSEKRFPHINFDKCEKGEEDPVWKEDYRETEEELKDRIRNLLQMIKKRPEKTIGIVTHQGYMVRLYQLLGIDFQAPKNCEIVKLNL